MQSTCRKCMGRRTVIKTPCSECQGAGKTVQRKTINVPVPAGWCYWLQRRKCCGEGKNDCSGVVDVGAFYEN